MNAQQLATCTGARIDRAAEWLPAIEAAMAEFGINTPARQAAFLAQIGHESGGLHWLVEIWGPTEAQSRYEGRKDLGNTEPGDGYRFRGRGLLQTTGRDNYRRTGAALGVDLIAEPELLGTPALAARSAAWYWQTHKLNELADTGDFKLITKRINGGYNGYSDRCARWEKAKEALGTTEPSYAAPSDADITITPKGTAVAPFLLAALPALFDAVPKLVKSFTDDGVTVPERNVAAVQIAVEAAKQAVGAANEQALVETLKADPEAAQKVRAAIDASWAQITDAAGIEEARKADAAQVASGAPVWRSPSFMIALALIPAVYMIVGSVVGLFGQPFSDDVRSAIANGVVGLILGGLSGYYWGSTTTKNRPQT